MKVAAITLISLISLAAHAGITGTDPRPPKTTVPQTVSDQARIGVK